MITASQIRGAAGAEYYCSGGREGPDVASYYTDTPEPAGVWSGAGAEALGLTGDVDEDTFRDLFTEYLAPDGTRAGKPPRGAGESRERLTAALAAEPGASLERREAIRASIEGASPTTGFDFTFSPVKSVTALHTAAVRMETLARESGDAAALAQWTADRQAIEAAVLAGNAAAMEHLAEHATTRVGRHGAGATGRWEYADGLVRGSFLQHTSRAGDPQLHVHNATLNRVLCADGRWRALDGQDLMRRQHAAGAIGQAVMREQLAATVGLTEWERGANGAWEVSTGIVPAQTCRLMSSRRRDIERRLLPAVRAQEERLGRTLSDLELTRLQSALNLATRKGKSATDPETLAEVAQRMDALAAQDGQPLEEVARAWVAHRSRGPAVGPETWSPEAVISQAIAECGQAKSTFRVPDLTASIMDRLPAVTGLDPEQTRVLADRLTRQALDHPDVVQVAGSRDRPDRPQPGDQVWGRPTEVLLADRSTLVAEEALRRAAVVRGAHHVGADQVSAWLDAHTPTIGADQRAAVVGIASSDAALTVLVGPAGTGKSFAAGSLSGAWSDLAGGRVIGLAVSQVAADILRDDGLDHALNVAAFLAAQERLAEGSTHPGDRAWVLRAEDVVMVDEASMVGTRDLTRVRERVEAAGARLVLTGDPRQLSAVEAGGVMGLLDGHAETYTLSEVRRFTEDWERDASLRLRAGDTDVLAEYDRHGRIREHPDLDATVTAVANHVVADMADGREVLAVAGTNAVSADVARRVRDQLVELGQVEPGPGVILGRDGNTATVGDVVQARRIDRALGLTNRQSYRVTAVTDDGGLQVVCERTGEVLDVPAAYVAADMQLAYAATVHAAQGRTVDSCHYLTTGADQEATYVGLTRGRVSNIAHVPVLTGPEDVAPGASGDRSRTGIEVLAAALDREPEGRSATLTLEADIERRASAAEHLTRIEDLTRTACRNRLERHLDDLVAEGVLHTDDRARLCADQGVEHLSRLLRAHEQAGADPRALLRAAVEGRDLADADSVAQVLAHRITPGRTPPVPASGAELPADIDTDSTETLAALHRSLTDRAEVLGDRLATDPPSWALDVLGPVPAVEDPRRAEWLDRAGRIAVVREATGHTDEHRVLPPPPLGAHATEHRAVYLDAWTAAGGPETCRDAALMSDGRLRIRLQAERDARAWEPPEVTDQLRAAEITADAARQQAALTEIESDRALAAGDLEESGRLRDLAAEHRAEQALRALDVERLTADQDRWETWAQTVAPTLVEADRVRGEAEDRGITLDDEPDRTTAVEYLDLDRDQVAAEDAHRPITEDDIHDQDQDVDVDPGELDALPELGTDARRAGFEAACTAVAERAADTRSLDSSEPFDWDRRRRWVLDEAMAAATADTLTDALGLD